MSGFNSRHVGECTRISVAIFLEYRRQLEKISDENNREPAEGLVNSLHFATNLIRHFKGRRREHRDFFNNNTFAFAIRLAICSLLAIRSTSASVSESLMPMPLHECSVIPPTCVAAMPVAAVIDGSMPEARNQSINSFIVCVFPLPVRP